MYYFPRETPEGGEESNHTERSAKYIQQIMKKLKYPIFCALSSIIFSSHAGLLNISTNNLQSRTASASGCTIIESGGATFQGQKILVVFAESNEENSDSTLTVQDLKGLNVWTNDDWLGNRYLNGSLRGGDSASITSVYTAGVGRTPKRPTDAGILVAFNPGEAICAFSKERTTDNLKSVSISITDITSLSTKSYSIESNDILKNLVNTK